MKMVVITKQDLLRLFKYTGLYLVGLTVGVFSGLLPLLAPLAGLPILLADRQLGRRAGQVVALVALVATWFLMDHISFVYIGLGLMVGYSLSLMHDHVPFRFALAQSTVAGFIWALAMNYASRLLQGEGLLPLLQTQFQQAITVTVERMQGLGLYTTEQIGQLQQYGELMLKVLAEQWAYLLFVYLLISAVASFLLARVLLRPAIREDLLASKAPITLAAATAIFAGLHYLMPEVAAPVVTNLWNSLALLMALAGFQLLFFYLRWLRVHGLLRLAFGVYLFFNPIAWRVLLLVGAFDAAFDYRYYARRRQAGETGSNE